MLVENNVARDDVVALKLITGDELIAKLADQSDGEIVITRPLALQIGVDPKTNQLGLQMIPAFMLAASMDSRFTISRSHVVCISRAAEDAKAGYIRNTTNLVVPGQQGRLQL